MIHEEGLIFEVMDSSAAFFIHDADWINFEADIRAVVIQLVVGTGGNGQVA